MRNRADAAAIDFDAADWTYAAGTTVMPSPIEESLLFQTVGFLFYRGICIKLITTAAIAVARADAAAQPHLRQHPLGSGDKDGMHRQVQQLFGLYLTFFTILRIL